MVDPEVVVGLLSEPVRLRVFGALVLGAGNLSEVAAEAGVAVPAAARALDRLVAGGLIEETPSRRGSPATYRVLEERLRATATAQAQARARARAGSGLPSGGASGPIEGEEEKVLGRFFADGRLVSIPSQRAKRLVVLDHLATRFEPGRVYPEQEVNFVLGTVHPDYAALRRYLVDEGFLERRDGFYWRSGGTFDVD